MVKIDSQNIPVPERERGEMVFMVSRLTKGRSFTASTEGERRLALVTAKRLGVKVTSRKVDGKGYRIWRTS